MANVKISGLTAYTDPVATDVLPIVDLVNDQTKKVKVEDLLKKFGLGTEALPSFAFTGDLDTGIYSPGANQLAVTAGGTQRLLIDASGNTTIQGNLTVNGTTTTVSSNTLSIKDKNIEIAVVSTPTDTTADGGGITLKGATDKTINWVNATDAWTLSEHINIASAKEYRINGTKVLDATSLGSALLTNSTSSTSTTTAATPNSVKTAFDLANAALPKSGGTMTGDIVFNSGQSIAGYTPRTSATGSSNLSVGTTAQRDGSPAAGMIRYNSTLSQFEGYGSAWGSIGGGATGGGSDTWAVEHDNTITTSYTIGAGKNVISAGPLTVNSGATITVPSGSNWVIV